jgi:hypothetical protein
VIIHKKAHGLGLRRRLVTGVGSGHHPHTRGQQQAAGKKGGNNFLGSNFHHLFFSLSAFVNRHPV